MKDDDAYYQGYQHGVGGDLPNSPIFCRDAYFRGYTDGAIKRSKQLNAEPKRETTKYTLVYDDMPVNPRDAVIHAFAELPSENIFNAHWRLTAYSTEETIPGLHGLGKIRHTLFTEFYHPEKGYMPWGPGYDADDMQEVTQEFVILVNQIVDNSEGEKSMLTAWPDLLQQDEITVFEPK